MTASEAGGRKSSPQRTWLVRLAIAIVAGIGIGAAAGVATVNKLDPGRAGQPDSLQLMLDSLAQRKASTDPRSLRRAADSTDAAQRAQRITDSTTLANDPSAPIVPAVLNLEEGAARDSIEEAGLTTGTVTFQASTAPLGVVVGTFPAVGQKVRAGTPVNLILSNGRQPSDTTDSPAAPDTSSTS
jgi:serine/threonine-protein kinase